MARDSEKQSKDEELVSYPTISIVCEWDKKDYFERHLRWRTAICYICGIEFDKKRYRTCPLCEMKKKLVASEKLGDIVQVHNNMLEPKDVDISVNSNESEKNIILHSPKYVAGKPVHDRIFFGTSAVTNKKIKWLVIDVQNNIAKLLSVSPLVYAEYEEDSWEFSKLREVLNKKLYNTYFSDDERKLIVESKTKYHQQVYNDIETGCVMDYVTVLSGKELRKQSYGLVDNCKSSELYSSIIELPENGKCVIGFRSDDKDKCLGYYVDEDRVYDYISQQYLLIKYGDCTLGICPVINIDLSGEEQLWKYAGTINK